MKLSYNFRRDIEHQLKVLCGDIGEKLRDLGHLLHDLEGARERLKLLSKNDLKRFNSIIRSTKKLDDEGTGFKIYLDTLKIAIEHRKYHSETELYYWINHEEVEEVK